MEMSVFTNLIKPVFVDPETPAYSLLTEGRIGEHASVNGASLSRTFGLKLGSTAPLHL